MSDQAAKNLREFDPNKPEFHPWATWVNYSGFKIHRSRAVAITRYNQHDYALFYRMGDNGLWEEVLRKCREDEHRTCSACKGTTLLTEDKFPQHGLLSYRYGNDYACLVDDTVTPNVYDVGRYALERKNRKLVYPFVQRFLCVTCHPHFT
jgi:hypothetical protein